MSHSLPGALQKEPASLQTLILEIIPQNVVHVMAEGLVLPVIFFAILLAVGLLSIGEKGRPLVALIESLNDVILKIVDWIMVLTPYGVLALISGVVSNTGLSGLKQLLQYMLVVLSGLGIHFLIVLPLLILILGRYSPIAFYKQMASAFSVAFFNF